MDRFTFIIIIFIIICFCSCNHNRWNQDYIFDKEIKIENPGDVNLTTPLSTIVDKVEIVPLEFSEECMIQEAVKVRIWNKFIYIQDKISIFIFDINGNYQNKISRFGKGPEEYMRITDFDINKQSGNIYIFDNMLGKLLEYYPNGTFKKEIINGLTGSTFTANNGFFYTYMSQANNQSKYCLNIYDENGNKVKNFIKSNFYETNITNKTILAGTSYDGHIPFHMDLDYNIYLLENDQIKPYLKIDFGKYQVDYSFKEKILLNPESSWKLLLDNNLILGLNNVHILSNAVYFEYVYHMMQHKVIYIENSEKLYKNFVDDLSLLYFQPPKCQYNNNLVAIYPVTSITPNIDRIQSMIDKGEPISEQGMKTLALLENTNIHESNPFVIFYTIK